MASDLITRGKDRLQEISMKLEQSHLVYLETDDSPLKLQQRHKLEGFIKEYLCLVPNENKYVFQETADILHRSAATLQEFSGYRAATAWSAISLYAANLLAQPWRREYRTLRTYSGYYKHEVEANLIGAELMFEQMGYKHTGLAVLTLEGPIDPDKVSSVSRDAIVAFVECQILKQIWENVSQNCTVSWLEVLEFREKHVGNPEQAIRALNYRLLEKMRENRAKTENYREFHYPQPVCVDSASPSVPYHIMPSYSVPPSQSEYRYIEDTNTIPPNYGYYQPIEYSFANRCTAYGCLPDGNKYPSNVNPYYNTIPGYGMTPTGVPTGKLIELDVPVTVSSYEKLQNRKHRISDSDEVDFCRRQQSTVEERRDRGERNSHDSWDFVYRNLESIGYSKDLGEREDILHKRDSKQQKIYKQNDNNEYRFEKKRTGRPDEVVESSMTNGRHHHDTLPLKKKSSSFDLMDSNRYHHDASPEDRSLHKEKRHTSQTLPIQRSHRSSDQILKIADSLKNLEFPDKEKEAEDDQLQDERTKWNCATCTFLNSRFRDICEMCGKSRRKGNEDKPLASGGKECPKCTLVNEKNVSICEACGISLKNSPTYI